MDVIFIGRQPIGTRDSGLIEPWKPTSISRSDYARHSRNRHLYEVSDFLTKIGRLHRAPLQQMARNAGIDHRQGSDAIRDDLRAIAKGQQDEEGGEIDRDAVLAMTVDELYDELDKRDLAVGGLKRERQNRLLEALGFEPLPAEGDE